MLVLYVFAALYGFFLAASLASFGCVVAERVPTGQSIGGRSHCACGRQLRAGENIPVIGWLRVRGTAPCCGAPIPARYVLAELVTGAAGALAGPLATHASLTGSVPYAAAAALLVLGAPTAVTAVLWRRA